MNTLRRSFDMQKVGYPLIVSDFDGTLSRSDETIAEETLAAIQVYKNNGGHFALCTGRMLVSILPIARRLGLSGLVACFQGSVVADIKSGNLVVDGYMPNAGAAEICRTLEEMHAHIHVYDTECYYSNSDNEYLAHYERIVGVKAIMKTDEPLSSFIENSGIRVRKLLVLVNPTDRDHILHALQEKYGKDYYVTCSAAFLVEVTNRNYSKATAVAKIAEYYGLSLQQTMTVGDSLNDLPMIEAAGLGIAVSNAEDSLKEKADVTLDVSNDEDAIGEIIRKYGFQSE
jgi:Cof subfamily protein (haloacid dehalogenase superfamily)